MFPRARWRPNFLSFLDTPSVDKQASSLPRPRFITRDIVWLEHLPSYDIPFTPRFASQLHSLDSSIFIFLILVEDAAYHSLSRRVDMPSIAGPIIETYDSDRLSVSQIV